MKHFLLFYMLSPDYMERRSAFRNEHLRLAWEAQGAGDLVLAGALHDPADTAVLLFAGEDGSAAEAFARADPYVTEGLVERWEVREWTTVIGDLAATPVRP